MTAERRSGGHGDGYDTLPPHNIRQYIIKIKKLGLKNSIVLVDNKQLSIPAYARSMIWNYSSDVNMFCESLVQFHCDVAIHVNAFYEERTKCPLP